MPVRIIRDDSLQSEIRGIYPCGEGAGYAGGITSAAMDGIKIAEMIAGTYRPLETKKIKIFYEICSLYVENRKEV